VVRPATAADLDAAARALAAAFADYPWTRWTVAADDHVGRLEALHRLTMAEVALPYGRLDVAELGGRVVGAAAWLLPDRPVPGHVWTDVAALDGPLLGDRAPHAEAADRATAGLRPAVPHAFLATVGVHPDAQGAGVGAALLRTALDDLDGVPAYLETSSPANVRLYARLGFAVTGEADVPDGGPHVWAMLRP
jgi:ribosomal protein S18 acetylase RimI-like enzyme